MFSIQKTFSFEYAHRIYSQDVRPEMAENSQTLNKNLNTCRNIHGHSGKIIVELKSKDIDNRGFVLDYKELGFIKEYINAKYDHKLILDAEDPLLEEISLLKGVDITVVPFIPTSELLAQDMYFYIQRRLTEFKYFNIQVKRVGWAETETSIAWYEE